MRSQAILWIVLALALAACREPKKTTPVPEPGPEPVAKLTPAGPDLAAVKKLVGEAKWDEALAVVDRELAAHPGYADLLFYQGLVHFNRKDFEKALAAFEAVQKKGMSSLELTVGLSETLFYLKRLDECEKVLRAGMEKFPKAAALWYNLGGVYAERKDVENTRKMYAEALLRDPDYGPALYSLSDLYASEKAWDKAVELLTKLTAQPQYKQLAHLKLAVVKSYQKSWDEALGHLAEVEKTNPEAAKPVREKILVSRAFSELGELIRTKKCKEARARLEVIRKEHPGSAALPKAQELLDRDCRR